MGDRWVRFLPLTGVVFAVLILVAFFVSGNEPSSSASTQKVVSFYDSHKGSTSASAYALAYASVFVIFFAAVLRRRLRDSANDGSIGLGFGGAIFLAIAIAVGSGQSFALSDSPKSISPAALQAVNLLGSDIVGPAVQIGMVAFMLGFGIAILRGTQVSRWFGWAAIALGILAAVPAIGFFSILGIVVWSIVLGLLLMMRTEMPAAVLAAA